MASPLGTLHYFDHRLEVHRVVVGPYANNVFVVRCKHTGEAVLIDAAQIPVALSLGFEVVSG